jgi:Mrp family chromosome partitioning ATPase
VLPVTDASVIAGRVDATLVVVNAGKTHRKQLARALETLGQVHANVIGLVVNGVRRSDPEAYGYAYGYGSKPYVTHKPRRRRVLARAADSVSPRQDAGTETTRHGNGVGRE